MACGVLADLERHHPETHGGQTQTPLAQPLATEALDAEISLPFETPRPFEERTSSLQRPVDT